MSIPDIDPNAIRAALARIAELEVENGTLRAGMSEAGLARWTEDVNQTLRIAELEAERDRTMITLRAIAQGYPIETRDDRYIIVENPKYQPDDGSDPKLVIDCWIDTPQDPFVSQRPKVVGKSNA